MAIDTRRYMYDKKYRESVDKQLKSGSSSTTKTTSSSSSSKKTSSPALGYGSTKTKAEADAINQRLASDPAFARSEYERTLDVISNRKAQGLDTSLQESYLNRVKQYYNPNQNRSSSSSGSNFLSNIVSGVSNLFKNIGQSVASRLPSAIQQYQQNQQYQMMQAQARALADAQIEAQRTALQNALNSLTQQRQNALDAIQAMVESGSDKLDHDFFRQYLKERQRLANDGLNAGYLADMNTRLLLGKQSAMEDLLRNALVQRGQVESEFGSRIGDLQGQLANLDRQEEALFAQYLQNLRKEEFDRQMEQQKYMLDYFEAMAPYMFPTMGQQLDFQRALLPYQYPTVGEQLDFARALLPYQYPTMDTLVNAQTELTKWFNPSANNRLDNETRILLGQMDNATKLQLGQISANARIQAARIAADARLQAALAGQNDTSLSDYDLQIFLENLNPFTDTPESVREELLESYRNGEITGADYYTMLRAADQYFNSFRSQAMRDLSLPQQLKNFMNNRLGEFDLNKAPSSSKNTNNDSPWWMDLARFINPFAR